MRTLSTGSYANPSEFLQVADQFIEDIQGVRDVRGQAWGTVADEDGTDGQAQLEVRGGFVVTVEDETGDGSFDCVRIPGFTLGRASGHDHCRMLTLCDRLDEALHSFGRQSLPWLGRCDEER